jgi:hypothetical protein
MSSLLYKGTYQDPMIKKPEEYAAFCQSVAPEIVVRWIFRDMLQLIGDAHHEGMGYPWVYNRIDQALNGVIGPVDHVTYPLSNR